MKLDELRRRLRSLESAVVAFSGGVDSSLLAFLARGELGERMLAVTGVSPSLPSADRRECAAFCESFSIPHRFIDTDEFSDPRYTANPDDRCYYCKRGLLERLCLLADEVGFRHVVEGTNMEDLEGHRPGRRASMENPRAATPLIDAGFTKQDVRAAARELGIPTAQRPSAACLASRVPSGVAITAELLGRIDRAEEFIRSCSGATQVRVRHHGEIARIEVDPDDMEAVMKRRGEIADALRNLGWSFAVMDLIGYRDGGRRG